MRKLMVLLPILVAAVAVAGPKDPVVGLMHKFLDYMTALKPYIVSEQRMNDPENDAEIRAQLKGLSQTVKEAKHQPRLKQGTLKVSREVLETHVYETERAFKTGNKNYARWMLQSTLSVCMSCHTQLPTPSKSFETFSSLDKFTSEFEQAEFMFAVRDFDKAHAYYDKAIKGYPDNKIPTIDLENAFERQVAYFARIKRDPGAGKNYLEAALKNEKIPDHVRKNVEAWAALFNEWTREKTPQMNKISEADLRKYVIDALKPELWDKMVEANNPRVMTYLKISGLLYEYLQYHPNSDMMPEILYWLSKCDRALNNNFFFSLADMYLKECIVSYPRRPVAAKCYQDLEDSTLMGYSGSSGTHVPAEVWAELHKLKKLIPKEKR